MYIIVFILTLFVLVVIHEFGHYFAAKKFHIKALEFGFGLPPRIFGKQIGETVWSLNWLPIGGFVRLLGEDDTDEKALKDKRSFAAQKVWKRIVVVVAGVTMNLVLSWLLFYIVIIAGGFRIVVPTAEQHIFVGGVSEGSPAKDVGLLEGERIISVNGESVDVTSDFQEKIKQNAGKETIFLVGDWQGGATREVKITPRENPPEGQGAIGIAISSVAIREFKSPVEKVFSAPIYSYEFTKIALPQTGKVFADFFTGKFHEARSQIAGPIGIAAVSGQILSNGWDAIIPYIYFTALLSLNLAFVNVLPFPGLDGGRLLFLVIEWITKKRPSPAVEKYVHSAGLVILMVLIIAITASDIERIIFKK